MSLFVFLKRKSFRFYAIIILLALLGRQCETKRTLDIYVTLLSYKIPKEGDAIVQANCSLTSIAGAEPNSNTKSKLKTHPAMSFSAKGAYDVTDIKVNLNISIERGGRYDSYLSTEIDLCQMRYSKVLLPVIRFFQNELIRVVKPRDFCPVKKGDLFEVNNFILSNSFLPPYAPELNWKADLKLWLNGRYAIAVVGMGKIDWINI